MATQEQGYPVFEIGQQHDCHEALHTILLLLAKAGKFETLQLQWDSRCLGPCEVSTQLHE